MAHPARCARRPTLPWLTPLAALAAPLILRGARYPLKISFFLSLPRPSHPERGGGVSHGESVWSKNRLTGKGQGKWIPAFAGMTECGSYRLAMALWIISATTSLNTRPFMRAPAA